MKQKLALVLMIALCGLLSSCKPKISGQIAVTWEPDANLRVVDGQLYDAYHSELWSNPIELTGFRSHGNPEDFRLLTYLAKVETVEGDKIQCGIYEQAHWPPVANGEVESENLVQEIVIYHYPNAESLVSGQDLGDCRCMRVANYISGGASLVALDCGVPDSAPVPMFNGARVKINSVQVCLVDTKEADDFLQEKKSESDEQCSKIKAGMEKLQSEIEKLQPELNDTSQSYTNDPRYIAMIKESEDAIQTAQTMANAITYLHSKYGDSPYSANMPLVRQYPKEYYDAWHAEDEDEARLQSIRRDANRMDDEIDSIVATIKNEKKQKIQAATEMLNEAKESLKPLQTPNFFLADFSPAALETSLTDEEGHFSFHNPKPGTKIFAKVKPDAGGTNEQFFWLVDLPPSGQKLVLSNGNLFNPASVFTSP